jgi:hypothetical protein
LLLLAAEPVRRHHLLQGVLVHARHGPELLEVHLTLHAAHLPHLSHTTHLSHATHAHAAHAAAHAHPHGAHLPVGILAAHLPVVALARHSSHLSIGICARLSTLTPLRERVHCATRRLLLEDRNDGVTMRSCNDPKRG